MSLDRLLFVSGGPRSHKEDVFTVAVSRRAGHTNDEEAGRDVGAALLKVEQRSTSSCARSCLHVLGMCGDG